MKEFAEVLAKTQSPVRCLIGIVARPEYATAVREKVREVERYRAGGTPIWITGVPVFIDAAQPEPFLPFYDHAVLRLYLGRNETVA